MFLAFSRPKTPLFDRKSRIVSGDFPVSCHPVVVYVEALNFISAETTGRKSTKPDRKTTERDRFASKRDRNASKRDNSMSLRARRKSRLTSDRLRFFDFANSRGLRTQSPRTTVRGDFLRLCGSRCTVRSSARNILRCPTSSEEGASWPERVRGVSSRFSDRWKWDISRGAGVIVICRAARESAKQLRARNLEKSNNPRRNGA